MSNENANLTKVIVPCRFSYLHCWEPNAVSDGDPKYSVSAIIPKSDTETIEKIKRAIEQAKKDSVSKWGGKVPANLKLPLRDGDIDRPEDEAYADSYFFNANSKQAPQVVDKNVQPSNHGDVEHLWSKFGLTMAQFRKDIKTVMEGGTAADSLTAIMGKPAVTADQMKSYLKKKNPSVPQSVLDMIPLYISEGEAEGVRGDIAFAQSCLETGNFTFSGSAVILSQNNFCGLGVTQRGKTGLSFDTPQLGIRAQIQHLKAYASTDKLRNALIDPRFRYVKRGCAPYAEWLGQKENPQGKGWAAGEKYGEKILSILKAIVSEGKVQFMESLTLSAPYMVRVSIPDLNIRRGPGTSYPKTGKFTGVGVFTVVEEKDGWGLLKAYQEKRDGWISLAFTTRM